MKLQLKIQAGEGGQDARLLVQDQTAIYLRFAERHGARASIVSQTPSAHG